MGWRSYTISTHLLFSSLLITSTTSQDRQKRAITEPCSFDSDCVPKKEFCAVLKFGSRECRAIRAVGDRCTRDTMCVTGVCSFRQCVECSEHSHCGSGACFRNACVGCSDNSHCSENQFCDNGFSTSLVQRRSQRIPRSPGSQSQRIPRSPTLQRQKRELLEFGLPPPTFTCQFILPTGRYCQRDDQCSSGVCDGAMCLGDRECRTNTDCPRSEGLCFQSRQLSIIPRTCVHTKIFDFCKNDTWCDADFGGGASDNSVDLERNGPLFCKDQQCIECDVTDATNCHAATQYCFAGYCVPKKCRGYCITGFMCLSGSCRSGLCETCNDTPNVLPIFNG